MNKHWFTRSYQPVVDKNYLTNMVEAIRFFMHWFCFSGNSFKGMLLDMHKIVSHNYQGYTNCNYIVKVSDGFRGDSDTTWYPILKKEWFTGIGVERIIRPSVPCMPTDMSHWLVNKEEGYELHLPDDKYVNSYLATMSLLMNRIKDTQNLDLKDLAAYIQLFVIGHPFEKINFSICMAQVNAILWLKGYKPIYHGWLDFECFMYDHHCVAEIFIKKVQKG